MALNHLPDVLLFPNDLEGYIAAKSAIHNNPNNYLVEVFGFGTGDSRLDFRANKIVIDRTKNEMGSIGSHGSTYYNRIGEGAESTFDKMQYADTTDHVDYEIRAISTNPVVESKLLSIIASCFGRMGAIDTYGTDGEKDGGFVTIVHGGSVNLKSTEDWMETMVKYQVQDAWIMADKVIATGLKVLSSMEINVYLNREPAEGADPDMIIKLP